jgi:hypothetical protein
MKDIGIDSIVEGLTLGGSALGTMLFTMFGVLTEQAGLQNVFSGHVAIGAWELWMGTLALVVGLYLFGYQQFWVRLQILLTVR